jgi:hypothetical protein
LYSLSRHNTGIGNGCRCLRSVATSYQASLATEVLLLDVKNQVTMNLLVPNGYGLPICANPKSKANVLHLLADCICPFGVAILLVQGVGFPDRVGYLNPKFEGLLEESDVLTFYHLDDPLPLLQDCIHPPVEGWLLFDAMSHCVLGHFNWV